MPPKNTSPTPAPERPLSFEDALANLEELVSKLEGGKLGLADSLEAYQQGVARLRQCYELLEKAELKIVQVSALDEQGRPRLDPYHDPSGTTDEEAPDALHRKAAARSQRRSTAKQESSDAGAPLDARARLEGGAQLREGTRSRGSKPDDQRLF